MKVILNCLTLILVLSISTADGIDRPNILWLTSEDNSVDWVGCYGNQFAETPHIDRLASEGFRYLHCYANAPVCAPSRSGWITGVYALSTGTHQMRSRYPIPHGKIKYYPDLLKQAGYYVGNVTKTDYNIGGRPDGNAWDTNKVDWKDLPGRQPFFMVINSTKSHESTAFGDIENTTHSPDKVRLAKYHPDIPEIRKNYAHYHDQVKKMDADIGKALAELERSGLSENTIVIYNSDNGGVLPRSKRCLYNSGTHCPLIVRIPEKFKHLRPAEPGTTIDRLVSFIDMPKTWLSLCGIESPTYMQGKIFLGPDIESREYHVSFRGRMDERIDNSRAIRDRRFLYIRNYMPSVPWGQHLNYLWTMKATQAWEEYHKAGKTDDITGQFFRSKPMEELFDTDADPDNVNNLATNPQYTNELARLSKALDAWQLQYFDAGLLPETELARRSEANNKTIYELVRDPSLYDLKGYQQTAALAMKQDPANLPTFYRNLSHSDSGIRYWSVIGCFQLQGRTKLDHKLIRTCLNDDSDHVRAMAAWTLYRDGEILEAQQCWNQLLSNSSYASLEVFNIIDWIGDGHAPYVQAMRACHYDHGEYIDRMKSYFGVSDVADTEKK